MSQEDDRREKLKRIKRYIHLFKVSGVSGIISNIGYNICIGKLFLIITAIGGIIGLSVGVSVFYVGTWFVSTFTEKMMAYRMREYEREFSGEKTIDEKLEEMKRTERRITEHRIMHSNWERERYEQNLMDPKGLYYIRHPMPILQIEKIPGIDYTEIVTAELREVLTYLTTGKY